MNVLPILVVSFVLLLRLGSVRGGACFCPDCHRHHDNQAHYMLDSHTHWHCKETEFCYMHKNRTQVDIFQCVALTDSRHQECLHKSRRNHHACKYFNNESDCTYCCQTRDCYLNLMTPPSHHVTSPPTEPVTTTTTTTTMSSPTRMTSHVTMTTGWRRQGCFSHSWGLSHFSLRLPHLYTQGHWTCGDDEVCLLHTRDGLGNIRCVPKNTFDPNACRGLEGGDHTTRHCHHSWNPSDCSYCCATPDCMHAVANTLSRQTTMTTSHANPVTSPPTTRMTSPPPTATRMTSPPTATRMTSPPTTRMTSPPTTATTVTSSVVSGIRSASNHPTGCFRGSSGSCHHNHLHYWEQCLQGDWICSLHEFCEVKVEPSGYVHMKCVPNQHRPQTCHSHHSGTSCMNLDLHGASDVCHFCCSDPACVRNLLQPHVSTATTPATVTTTTPAAVTTTTTAAVTTTTAAAVTTTTAAVTTTAAAAVTTTAAAAAAANATSSSNATSAMPMTNISTTPMSLTTTAHKIGQCVQCGDYNSRVPCSNMELFVDSVSACTDPAADLCMTDVDVDANGAVSIYKRCVNVQACLDQWYLQSSDKGICQQLDPAIAPPNINCHYCCVVDGCNTDILPNSTTFWKP